ncbi:MAG: O-antigen ligase family protein [Blautia sp.]|nr:O-antigen ligase family protein [Blautia sp.]MCM1202163.1 O-antigen ligase family protein [Bacteroides fragilis]
MRKEPLKIGINQLGAVFCIIFLVMQPFLYAKISYFELYVVLIAAVTVFNIVLNKKVYLNTYLIGYTAFAFYCLCSYIWSPNESLFNVRFINVAVYLLIILNIGQYLLSDSAGVRQKCEYLMDVYLFCLIVMTVFCYLAAGNRLRVWARLGAGVYSTQIHYSCFLLVGMIFAVYKCLFTAGRKRKVYFGILFFLYLSSVLTAIRKLLIVPFICIYLFFLLKYRKRILKITGITICAACILLVSFYMIMNYSVSMSHRIQTMMQQFFSNKAADVSITDRNFLRALAIQCFKETPLFGYGLGQFTYYSVMNGGPGVYAHDNFAELLATLGIIGTLLYYVPPVYHIAKIQKKHDISNDYKYFMIAVFITIYIIDIFQVSFYYESYAVLYIILSCLL